MVSDLPKHLGLSEPGRNMFLLTLRLSGYNTTHRSISQQTNFFLNSASLVYTDRALFCLFFF